MERVIVREVGGSEHEARAIEYAGKAPDGDLLDADIFRHSSTFLLEALQRRGRLDLGGEGIIRRLGYLPIQQPLMLENLLVHPSIVDAGLRAVVIAKLAEAAISEAYRRDAGELYFLCRHPETCAYAERHLFERIDGEESRLKMKIYRLNLRETFGC